MIDFIVDNTSLTVHVAVKRFDASYIDEFREKLSRVQAGEFDPVRVDLEGVEMIDSSGVGALLGLQKKVGSAEQRLILENAGPVVVSVIELLRLHRVFDVRGSTNGSANGSANGTVRESMHGSALNS